MVKERKKEDRMGRSEGGRDGGREGRHVYSYISMNIFYSVGGGVLGVPSVGQLLDACR